MHTTRMTLVGLLVLVINGILCPVAVQAAESVPRITREEARALLGFPNVVFIDARTNAAWNASDRKIKGAVRVDKWDLDTLVSSYAGDTKFIVY